MVLEDPASDPDHGIFLYLLIRLGRRFLTPSSVPEETLYSRLSIRARLVWPLLLCSSLCGCIGAIRLPVRAVNPAGEKIDHQEIDLKFLQVGVTERQEVDHQLALVNTSYDNPRLFWGRWSESRWGYWWVLGIPCDNCMAGDARRLWRIKNLLVAFDDKGAVSGKEIIGDDKIWMTLRARIADIHPPTLDISQPIRITLSSDDPVAIRLSPNSLEFERPPDARKPTVVIPVSQLVRFKHNSLADSDPFSSVTCHALELSNKSTLGKKIRFCGEAAEIGILFEYLQQTAPANMSWR